MRIQINVNKTTSNKGKFFPLFTKMNHSRNAQLMIQLLGESFLGELFHNTPVEGGRTYVNLDDADGVWQIGKPEMHDVINEQYIPIPVPPHVGELKAFLWENSTVSDEMYLQMWEACFVEGEYEEKKDGKPTGQMRSKNFIQEAIMENIEWSGSRLEGLLGAGVDVGELTAPEQTPAEANGEAEALEY